MDHKEVLESSTTLHWWHMLAKTINKIVIRKSWACVARRHSKIGFCLIVMSRCISMFWIILLKMALTNACWVLGGALSILVKLMNWWHQSSKSYHIDKTKHKHNHNPYNIWHYGVRYGLVTSIIEPVRPKPHRTEPLPWHPQFSRSGKTFLFMLILNQSNLLWMRNLSHKSTSK